MHADSLMNRMLLFPMTLLKCNTNNKKVQWLVSHDGKKWKSSFPGNVGVWRQILEFGLGEILLFYTQKHNKL